MSDAPCVQDFLRNVKREFGKLLALMQAYALISTRMRLIVTHSAGRAPRATVLHTQGGGTLRDNIVTVLGAAAANAMQPFTATLVSMCTVSGYISCASAGSGRSTSDRQFLYVNGRPVDLPRVAKTLNEVYRAFNATQLPAAVLDFALPTDAYDVNVTPDKRRVLLHAEDELLVALHDALTSAYEPSRGTYAVGAGEPAALAGAKRRSKPARGRADHEPDWVSGDDTDDDLPDDASADSPCASRSGDDDADSGDEAPLRKRLRASGGANGLGLQAADAHAAGSEQEASPAAPQAPDSAVEDARCRGPVDSLRTSSPAGKAPRVSAAEQSLMKRFVTVPQQAVQPLDGHEPVPTVQTPMLPLDEDDTPLVPAPAAGFPADLFDTQPPAAAPGPVEPAPRATLTFDLDALRVRPLTYILRGTRAACSCAPPCLYTGCTCRPAQGIPVQSQRRFAAPILRRGVAASRG